MLSCLRCTLKPSASATVMSKLYQHFRVYDHLRPTRFSAYVLSLIPHLPVRCPYSSNFALCPGSIRVGGAPLQKPSPTSSRQELSPCKLRRVLLGAITIRLTCRKGNSVFAITPEQKHKMRYKSKAHTPCGQCAAPGSASCYLIHCKR